MKAEEDPKQARIDERRLPIRPPPRGEDLPYDDGEPMESDRHREQMILLIHALEQGWTARRDFYVAGNHAVYFSELQTKRLDFRAPDFYIVLGVEPKERKSWVVWEEGGATPDVVIEILSESTEAVDRHEKMRIYSKVLKVAVYALYEPFTHLTEVYELDGVAKEYRRVEPNAAGRWRCAPLGLELGLWEGTIVGIHTRWLRWFTPDGALVETESESAIRRAEEAKRRADEEQRRADEEQRRADDERRRADEEQRRADEAKRRADDEQRRADDEKRRADTLEAELAELRRKLQERG